MAQRAGDALSVRAQQLAKAGNDAGEVEMGLTQRSPAAGPACDPQGWSEQQLESVAIMQTARATGAAARNGQPFYENEFKLDFLSGGTRLEAGAKDCLLRGIDRVVYHLDPRWFSNNEVVRINRDGDFAYNVTAWGATPISVEVFRLGSYDPERFVGSIVAWPIAEVPLRKDRPGAGGPR